MSIAGELIKELNERRYVDWKAAAANDDSLDDVKQVKINKFKVNDFVYDTVKQYYGIVKQLNDNNTALVDFKRTRYGALVGIESIVDIKTLKDGDQVINKEIASLERKIQTQNAIRDEIMAIPRSEV
jgi:CTP-dependent riboflavin kinase